ncbi:GNAT family N-acetyltransferase [Paenibacillus protaetiae]|uniref:GNAT family N-acetyltransferase n=1 Tax=Paenibacillus protaetiae TaxID=2509456 RepID=A0A4P6ES00_9BACL|nr:GNAT family N-acetyltransferase [Paenibacillus protaetiae]QAY65860.1 GNAT family N-acetyltransferase [Paenibacillus protaetiae]
MNIRMIKADDNSAIESVIRQCLIEFGGNRSGLAWEDESLSHLSDYYAEEGRAYWIACSDEGTLWGGCGIAEFGDPEQGICELQKMYLLPEARGTGIAAALLDEALAFASRHYRACYLETLQNMQAANRFYAKHQFEPLNEPLAGSEHFACDAWYIRYL